ncbi:MAG: DUF167 domain-containing protein [Verrucomicrobia bacterium]|nr:DUF167 domain-containing protein [Verrucomicrobiota bacterium]
MAPCLRSNPNGVYLAVKLQPRAARNEIASILGSELKIKVTAPPVDAAANQALLRLLVENLGCARGAVQLVQGHKSTHKVVFLEGFDADTVERKLLRAS